MATPLPLEGDGLVENLFHYLWTTDDLGGGPRVSVPPTVIYRGSQPVAWYFTSRKSGRIKRKHRANLTAAHIEHSFTKRKASTDIVAYYLYLPNAESTSPSIEYYDAEALREFLFKRPEIPHSSTGAFQSGGILQQFALPKGSRNSTLRAIWSPKLCLLERRVNIHAVHDARFSVYERGVTFEEGGGAEALTRPEPVRGSMLPGMVQQLCERVVDHVTRVSYHKFRIARMVLRLQVDADDRLWLLWSSSLRLQPPLAPATMVGPEISTGEPSIRPLDIVSDAKVPTFAFAQGSGGGPVSLSSTCGPEVDEEPRPGQTRCASCAQVVGKRALLPTTYKAVLAHFQHVLRFLREKVNEENQVAIEWPPDDRVVQQAGGVGFGILRHLKSMSSSVDDSSVPKPGSGLKTWQGRELLIPPVIRYLHPTLRPEDFARHRQDPIFLHKAVGVCERCCLVYADYATASLEANALGIRSSASAPALLRPVREKPKHAEFFDDEAPDSLLLTTANSRSPLGRGTRIVTSKTKPPASAWKPVPTDDRGQQSLKYKTGPRSTLHSLPVAPKLPPRIETFEPGDNDALRIPDAILHDDGSPQHQQQQREEAFFRELYQQKDTVKRGGHALRHILEAADRLSKAKPQHRLAALGNSTQIGRSQSTGALAGAISELKLCKKTGKSPYSVVQRIRDGKVSSSKAQKTGNASPAKSPLTHDSKPVKKKKKTSKKKRSQDESGGERARFISSREKRAAAAHRGYLVAALSDAQVQLEHIESLASLVIPVPDMEAEPIKPDQNEQQVGKKKTGKEERPPSPQEDEAASAGEELEADVTKAEYQGQSEQQLEDTQQQDELERQELDHEEEHQEDNLLQEEPQEHQVERQEEHQEQEQEQEQELEQEQHNGGFEDHAYAEAHLDAQEQEEHNGRFEDQECAESHLDVQEHQVDAEPIHEDESHTQQQNTIEDEQEKPGDVGQSSQQADGTDIDWVPEADHQLEEYEQETQKSSQLMGHNDPYEAHSDDVANQLVDDDQGHNEEPLREYEQQDQGSEQHQGQENLPILNQTGEADSEIHHDQEIQQEPVQVQEDDDQDEYEDEYEDQDADNEGEYRDEEDQGQVEHGDSIETPAQNLLEQARELLDTSDSAEEDHGAVLEHNISSDTSDTNDHTSILSPLALASVAHDDESSDDAVIAADSAVAAALPLPPSDESSNEA